MTRHTYEIVRTIVLTLSLMPRISLTTITDFSATRFGDDQVSIALIHLLKTCVLDKDSPEMVLAGQYENFVHDHRDFMSTISVALVANSKYSAFEEFTVTKYSFNAHMDYHFWNIIYKFHVFTIIASSVTNLRMALQKIKDSPWANSDGFYVLTDLRTRKYGCQNARMFLSVAWEYDHISTVFICLDPIDGLYLYTYSPYSDLIPQSWSTVEILKGRRGHPWYLLNRKYQPGPSLCQDLFFEKTINLNGYEVRMNAVTVEPLLTFDPTQTGLNKFSGENAEVVKALWTHLNASVYVTVYNSTIYTLGGIDKNGTAMGTLADLIKGKDDMAMNTRSLFTTWKLRYTYPHAQAGLCVMTRKRGYASQISKLMAYLSVRLVVGMLLICVMTHYVLMKQEPYFAALLNIVRLLVCVSILKLPRAIASRIYLCMVFFFFLTVNAGLQSHWSSLLSVAVPNSNIETIQDLKDSGYTIYGPSFLKTMLAEPLLESRFHICGYDECKGYVKNVPHSACLGDCLHQLQRIRNEQTLYRSRRIREFVHTFMTRENWPLYERMNGVIQRMLEAGLPHMWRKRGLQKLYREWKINVLWKNGYQVLVLDQLAFSFYILSIGYTLATIILAIEIYLASHQECLIYISDKLTSLQMKFKKFKCLRKNRSKPVDNVRVTYPRRA